MFGDIMYKIMLLSATVTVCEFLVNFCLVYAVWRRKIATCWLDEDVWDSGLSSVLCIQQVALLVATWSTGTSKIRAPRGKTKHTVMH